jgi:hypothetical protein
LKKKNNNKIKSEERKVESILQKKIIITESMDTNGEKGRTVLEVGADGVAIITIVNPPVNSLSFDGTIHLLTFFIDLILEILIIYLFYLLFVILNDLICVWFYGDEN